MAIAHVRAHGTAVSSTIGTSFGPLAPAASIPVGAVLVLHIAADNMESADGATTQHSAVTDSGGNTWTKLAEYSNANSAPQNGAAVSVWVCRVTTALTTSSTITATLSSLTVDKCMTMNEFSVSAGKTLALNVAAVTNGVDAVNGFGSAAFAGLPSLERLYYRGLCKEANTTTALTVSAGFTATTATRSRNNAAAISIRGEFAITTATGATSNPTLAVSGFTAGAFVALEEATPVVNGTASATFGVSAVARYPGTPAAQITSSTSNALLTASRGSPEHFFRDNTPGKAGDLVVLGTHLTALQFGSGWASRDGGYTWTALTPNTDTISGSPNASFFQDDNGRVHVGTAALASSARYLSFEFTYDGAGHITGTTTTQASYTIATDASSFVDTGTAAKSGSLVVWYDSSANARLAYAYTRTDGSFVETRIKFTTAAGGLAPTSATHWQDAAGTTGTGLGTAIDTGTGPTGTRFCALGANAVGVPFMLADTNTDTIKTGGFDGTLAASSLTTQTASATSLNAMHSVHRDGDTTCFIYHPTTTTIAFVTVSNTGSLTDLFAQWSGHSTELHPINPKTWGIFDASSEDGTITEAPICGRIETLHYGADGWDNTSPPGAGGATITDIWIARGPISDNTKGIVLRSSATGIYGTAFETPESGPATVDGTASATIEFTANASVLTTHDGAASASVSVTASVAGAQTCLATGTATASVTGTASGKLTIPATASATAALTATAAGATVQPATASATLGVAGKVVDLGTWRLHNFGVEVLDVGDLVFIETYADPYTLASDRFAWAIVTEVEAPAPHPFYPYNGNVPRVLIRDAGLSVTTPPDLAGCTYATLAEVLGPPADSSYVIDYSWLLTSIADWEINGYDAVDFYDYDPWDDRITLFDMGAALVLVAGTASATAALTASAAADLTIPATGVATVSVTGTAQDGAPVTGTASATASVTASATATLAQPAAASATTSLTATAAPVLTIPATGAGTTSLTATAAPVLTIPATGTAAASFTASAHSGAAVGGTANAAVGVVGTAGGTAVRAAAATADAFLTVSAAAKLTIPATGTATASFAATAGISGTVTDTASAAVQVQSTAAGTRCVTATATASGAWAADVTPRVIVAGSVSTSIHLDGATVATVIPHVLGVVTTSIGFGVTAAATVISFVAPPIGIVSRSGGHVLVGGGVSGSGWRGGAVNVVVTGGAVTNAPVSGGIVGERWSGTASEG